MPATEKIREHMEVIGSEGTHVGTVDHLAEGDRIKLTKSDAPDGVHHFISTSLIDHVDEHVHLNVTAEEAQDEWEEADEEDEDGIDLEDDDTVEDEPNAVDVDEDESAR